MIITKLMGGLGNQMFQYSLGRRLAHERGVPLKLDLSWFRDAQPMGADTVREYALAGWRIQASIATPEDLSRFPRREGLLARLGLAGSSLVRERGFGFSARVLRAPTDAHLAGYWQSEKYFKPIRAILLHEFTMVEPVCGHAAALLDRVNSSAAVAIHVRRGDYVNNPSTHEFHGVCPLEYFLEAARRIADRVTDPQFFIFSDDPDWVRDNLRLAWPMTLVMHNGDCAPHQDMWLMSRCSHHIIANSSFSWWGAWLSSNEDKMVIAPRRWFRDPKHFTGDLIPEAWTRI